MKGRPQSVNFSPKEFQELSREERVLRGRISTLKKMIQRREDKIEELMKPVLKKKLEVNSLKEELGELKTQIKELGVEFPTFRVEEFPTKGKYYVRGVWYVKGIKKQKYLGSTIQIRKELKIKVDDETKGLSKVELDKIEEHFLPQLQLNFWEKEYEEFKKSK